MLKSMTGFGRYHDTVQDWDITIEMKSVNHKYLDFNIKLPRTYGFLEEKIRNLISGYIKRGKIDVYLSVVNRAEDDKVVSLNTALAKNYYDVLSQLAEMGDIQNDVSVSSLSRFSDIFEIEKKEEDQDALWAAVESVLRPCVEDFAAMREREGQRLHDDISGRLAALRQYAAKIEELAPGAAQRYQKKLQDKINELLGGAAVDENRIITEAAIYADKVAVDEETVRLQSHFSAMQELIDQADNAGKKLDFLIQEMNRETNTIGSKANDLEITKIVVDMKAELEKMREQIQNVE